MFQLGESASICRFLEALAARQRPSHMAGSYITTAISYPNGPPHIGHAYEAIAAT